eukprot:14276282-Alexandrium_andersonii.AAC.1
MATVLKAVVAASLPCGVAAQPSILTHAAWWGTRRDLLSRVAHKHLARSDSSLVVCSCNSERAFWHEAQA